MPNKRTPKSNSIFVLVLVFISYSIKLIIFIVYKKAFLYKLTHHRKEGMSAIFIFLQKKMQGNDRSCPYVVVHAF